MAHDPGIIRADRSRHVVEVDPYAALRVAVSRFYAIPRTTLAPLTNEAILGMFAGMHILESYYQS